MTDALSTPAPSPAPTPTPTPAPAPAPSPSPSPAPAAAALTNSSSDGATASWRDSLPEELRGDATLSKYGDIEALARGHLETKKLASGKVVLPGETPESVQTFMDAVRPADAKVYDITVPEGMPADFADKFREVAHAAALLPDQVKPVVEFYNQWTAAAIEAENAKSQAEIDSFKAEFGPRYAEKLASVGRMLDGLDLEDDTLAHLDVKLGSKNLMKFMFDLHDRVGDVAFAGEDTIDLGSFGALSPEQADGKLKELQTDADWRAKAQIKGSAEYKDWHRLTNLSARKRP